MEANKNNETKYERIRKIGIGSYGVVFKCINRQTGQIVAIKRYSENDSDPIIRKIAMREVRMLRQLKHPNLIQLIEVFRRRRILHLVFDYCELTVLDVIEKYANNCPLNLIRKIIWQLVNGVSHCHSHNCIHRDIKPENILINQAGVVKLCDFGFARNINANGTTSGGTKTTSNPMGQREAQLLLGVQVPSHQTPTSKTAIGSGIPSRQPNEPQQAANGNGPTTNKENRELLNERQALTEYVATRWYRAPELLVGDIFYDIKIDIWAIGCVTAELMRGEPLWPGKTDLDQLCLIKNSLGQLTSEQAHNLLTRGLYEQAKIDKALSQNEVLDPLDRKLPGRVGQLGVEFVLTCLQMNPDKRPTSDELLQHPYIHSALMGQFVRGASHAAPQPMGATNATSEPGQNQKAVGHGMVVGRPVAVAGPVPPRSGLMVHRSNSQAILRVANSQQPASKRLVLEPDSSHGDSRRSPSKGGSVATAYGGNQTTKHGNNSEAIVSMPIRSRQSATSGGDDQHYAVRQSRHKRKAPRQSTLGQLNQAPSQLELAKGRLNLGEPTSETSNTKRSPSQPASRRAAKHVPSAHGGSSSSFGMVAPSSSSLASRFSSSQSNLPVATSRRRSSDGAGGNGNGNGNNSLSLQQQSTSSRRGNGHLPSVGSQLVSNSTGKDRNQRSTTKPPQLNHKSSDNIASVGAVQPDQPSAPV